jgi:hypothetical protein
MYNSIQKKYGKCIDCSSNEPEQYIIAKRCPNHYKIYRAKIKLEKQKTRNKVRSLHSLPANRSMVDKNKDGSKDELALCFAKRMSEVPAICDNCGAEAEWIKQPKYYKLWKAAKAHLLEKRHFKSIQTHPLNFLTLFAGFSGVCDCHDDYDHDWERASKMNVWETVINRFKILYPLIAPEERKFIPQVLLETLKTNKDDVAFN